MDNKLTVQERMLLLKAIDAARMISDMNYRDPAFEDRKAEFAKQSNEYRALYKKIQLMKVWWLQDVVRETTSNYIMESFWFP